MSIIDFLAGFFIGLSVGIPFGIKLYWWWVDRIYKKANPWVEDLIGFLAQDMGNPNSDQTDRHRWRPDAKD